MGHKAISASWQISTWCGLTENPGFLLCFANWFALLQREEGEKGRQGGREEGGRKEGREVQRTFLVLVH